MFSHTDSSITSSRWARVCEPHNQLIAPQLYRARALDDCHAISITILIMAPPYPPERRTNTYTYILITVTALQQFSQVHYGAVRSIFGGRRCRRRRAADSRQVRPDNSFGNAAQQCEWSCCCWWLLANCREHGEVI